MDRGNKMISAENGTVPSAPRIFCEVRKKKAEQLPENHSLTGIRWKAAEPDRMRVNEKNGVVWLTGPFLTEMGEFIHGFSTRIGGVSEGDLASMNLSFSRGDSPESVRENFARISGAIGFEPSQMVFSCQTHTANVRIVTRQDCGNGFERKQAFKDVDGMITDEPGVILTTFYADCVPLFFVDPVHRAAGLSHSGWRGTAARIGAVTAERMKEAFGTRPEDLRVAIGPSICADCYEVSGDVIRAFDEIFSPEERKHIYRQGGGPDKYQLDLWQANRLILQQAGIPEENIHLPGICTCCNPDLLFSHRATGGRRGNLAGFLGVTQGTC